MSVSRTRSSRRGATTVEFAFAAGVLFLLIVAIIVGGLGVFRYQEVAHLAREGARYASTHGGKYQLDGAAAQTGVPAVSTSAHVRDYLLTRSTALDPARLQITAAWSAPNSISPINMPTYVDPDPSLVPPGQKVIRNYVTVTVTYQWVPEAFLFGPITLSSTSTMAMSY